MSTKITVSPHLHKQESTQKIMWTVTLTLVPAAVWGVIVFGLPALLTIIFSIASSAGAEYLVTRKKPTLYDGSAVLTGLLIGLNMPPAVPFYIPIAASAFAIFVVKWSFGGLGGNWMNPALAGRVFVFFSWTGHMTSWKLPAPLRGVDAMSGATPLGAVKAGLLSASESVSGPIELLRTQGFEASVIGRSVSDALSGFGISLDPLYGDFFMGTVSGSIGEVSALLLILGAVYLFSRKIITWPTPVSFLGSFMVLTWIFGGLRFGNGLFSGDVLFHLFTGGLMLGVLFMATDMVTSPLTRKGQIIYGLGCGFLTFLIRFYGSFPEGVSLAIILMNIFVPMINRYTPPVLFGAQKKAKGEA